MTAQSNPIASYVPPPQGAPPPALGSRPEPPGVGCHIRHPPTYCAAPPDNAPPLSVNILLWDPLYIYLKFVYITCQNCKLRFLVHYSWNSEYIIFLFVEIFIFLRPPDTRATVKNRQKLFETVKSPSKTVKNCWKTVENRRKPSKTVKETVKTVGRWPSCQGASKIITVL